MADNLSSGSLLSLPHHLFYRLHPFHLLLDTSMAVLQAGQLISKVAPHLRTLDHVGKHFQVTLGQTHPGDSRANTSR